MHTNLIYSRDKRFAQIRLKMTTICKQFQLIFHYLYLPTVEVIPPNLGSINIILVGHLSVLFHSKRLSQSIERLRLIFHFPFFTIVAADIDSHCGIRAKDAKPSSTTRHYNQLNNRTHATHQQNNVRSTTRGLCVKGSIFSPKRHQIPFDQKPDTEHQRNSIMRIMCDLLTNDHGGN